jgi:hypothetical protein
VLIADVLDLMDSTITNIAAPTIAGDMASANRADRNSWCCSGGDGVKAGRTR